MKTMPTKFWTDAVFVSACKAVKPQFEIEQACTFSPPIFEVSLVVNMTMAYGRTTNS